MSCTEVHLYCTLLTIFVFVAVATDFGCLGAGLFRLVTSETVVGTHWR